MSAPLHESEVPTRDWIRPADWLVQRCGWVAFTLLLLAAVIGLLGPGPLSKRSSTSEDTSLQAEFYAVERYQAPAEIRLFARPLAVSETLEIAFTREFTDATSLRGITPPPRAARLQGDRLIYEFAVGDLREVPLVYRFEYDDFGVYDFEVTASGGAEIAVRQYVLP